MKTGSSEGYPLSESLVNLYVETQEGRETPGVEMQTGIQNSTSMLHVHFILPVGMKTKEGAVSPQRCLVNRVSARDEGR